MTVLEKPHNTVVSYIYHTYLTVPPTLSLKINKKLVLCMHGMFKIYLFSVPDYTELEK